MSVLVSDAPLSDAPSSLAELLSPLPVEDFLDLLQRRELAYRPGSRTDRFAPLAGWAALRRVLEEGKQPIERDGVRVTKESHVVQPAHWTSNGKIDTAKLEEFLKSGFSVVILRIEAQVPALAAICAEIKERLNEGSFVGAVVTSGVAAGAFKVHFDPEDLLILQLEGTKRWQIFGPVVSDPVRTMRKPSLDHPAVLLDEVLEPGDLLFVPGGYWHHCESGLATSVHLGIFFLSPTGWHATQELIRPLIEDELFRKRLSRLKGEHEFPAIEAEIKDRLMKRIEQLDLRGFVSRWSESAY